MAETVEIEVHIVRRSASALLVHDGEREAWLPKSQVKVLPAPSRERREHARLTVPVWLAVKKGFV
jgi:hypothetical protein